MPVTAACSSPKRRGPSSSSATTSSDQRSPSAASARSSAARSESAAAMPAVYAAGAIVACKLQVTPNIADIAERVGPSVVGLGTGARGGSGVIVEGGAILTLARNVVAAEVTADGLGAPPVAWADAGPAAIGTPVAALADPAGHGLRATAGAIASAPRGVRGPRGRLIEGVVEHTAPLPRGSGGGPLVDADGRLLGL